MASTAVEARSTAAVVLLVRHLPESAAMPTETIQALFRDLGATEIRLMGETGKMKNTAFLSFQNREIAILAQRRLSNFVLGGKQLSAEFATPQRTDLNHDEMASGSVKSEDEPPLPPNAPPPAPSSTDETHLRRIPTMETAEPISAKLGFDYPSAPNLVYRYPPPNPVILANIMHAIAAVPKLYTQVLHLMNKMNLLPPFGPITPVPAVLRDDRQQRGSANSASSAQPKRDDLLASDESEIESDGELKGNRRKPSSASSSAKSGSKSSATASFTSKTLPAKQQHIRALATSSGMKRRASRKAAGQTGETQDDYDDEEERGAKSKYAKISEEIREEMSHMNKSEPSPYGPAAFDALVKGRLAAGNGAADSETKADAASFQGGTGSEHAAIQSSSDVLKANSTEKADLHENDNVASSEEAFDVGKVMEQSGMIESKSLFEIRNTTDDTPSQWPKMNETDLKAHVAARNYSQGDPSSTLYIRNLDHKKVQEEHLLQIFGKYFGSKAEFESIGQTRLLKEGRLKGQAFIKFATVDDARRALEETHGLLVFEKPMIVVQSCSLKQPEHLQQLSAIHGQS